MAGRLHGHRVAFLVANEGVEQVELTSPWQAIEDEGGEPELISIEAGTVQAFDHLDTADTFDASLAASEASAEEYLGLVLPGGVANPDRLRLDGSSVALVGSFFAGGKPVAAICHAPWLLVEADAVRGRRLTSFPSIRTDVQNAGGLWIDDEVVTCNHGHNALVTSRRPGDLPAFNAALLQVFADSAVTV